MSITSTEASRAEPRWSPDPITILPEDAPGDNKAAKPQLWFPALLGTIKVNSMDLPLGAGGTQLTPDTAPHEDEVVDPDLGTPRSYREMADEHREFLKRTKRDWVDLDE